MAKHMCTGHEELYKNFLKPQMKVGNDLVAQVSNKNRVNTLMQHPPPPRHHNASCTKYPSTGFKLNLTGNDAISVHART
jgi:hypothetical protein